MASPRPVILILEDDPHVSAFLERLLSAAGYEVCAAHDEPQAQECVTRLRPAFLLVDLVFGPANGWQVARAIAPDVPFLIITGASVDSDARRDAELLGAVGMLQKPFDAAHLLSLIRGALH